MSKANLAARVSVRSTAFLSVILAMSVAGFGQGRSDLRIVQAARADDVAAIRALVRERVDVNAVEGDGGSALLWAAYRGNAEAAQVLIAAGANPNLANRFNVTPLLQAARLGHAGFVQQLVAAGADPRREGPDGETPLMAAAAAGSVDAVKLLIARGVPVNARERGQGQSALDWAALEGHAAVVTALLDAGADINAVSRATRLSRERAPDQGRAWVDHPTGGFTPLMFAARQGQMEAARVLAMRGAAVNLATPDGVTALILAVVNDHLDVAAMLVDSGADGSGGPLYEAIQIHNARQVETVNDATRARRFDRNTITPPQLVTRMLDKGADPNRAATHTMHVSGTLGGGTGGVAAALNETPFARALRAQDVAMLRALLAHGVNPNTPLAGGQLPIVAAMGGGGGARGGGPGGPGGAAAALRYPADRTPAGAVRALIEAGASVNAAGPSGDTALHAAAQTGNVAMIQLLADSGANLTATNGAGFTPLDVAMGRQAPAPVPAGPGPAPARAGGLGGRGGGGPQPQAIVLLRQLMGLPPLSPAEMPAAPAGPGGGRGL